MNRFEIRMAWRQLRGRGTRAWLFVFCIAIGVAAWVSVGSFMGQVSRAVNRESRSLLAADLEVISNKPLVDAQRIELEREAGPAARIQNRADFLSVFSAGPKGLRRSRLCEVSAVEVGYPFYGTLRASLEGGGEASHADTLDDSKPVAWVAPELLPQLGIHLGDLVKAGHLEFRVVGVLREEPGLAGGGFSLGPRVLIGLKHLKATGLAGFGSRVNYSALIAVANPEMADALAVSLRTLWRLGKDANVPGPPSSGALRVRTFKDAEKNLQHFFDRLADFLSLASLMALLLGGIGVASVVRAFIREQYSDIGVMRTLGASGNRIARIYLMQCIGLGFFGSLLGAILGTAMQNLLPWILGNFLPFSTEFGVDIRSCISGLGLGLLTATLFSVLPIVEARSTAPAQLFRGESIDTGGWRWWIIAIFGALLFTLVGAWTAHSFQRGGGFIGALVGGGLLIWGCSSLVLPRLAKLRIGGTGMRHGFSNLARPGLRPSASVIALGCAALHLGVIAIYQGSLLTELDPGKRPDQIPGLFMIDVQSDQVGPLKAWLESEGLTQVVFSPMVKARYLGKNGEALQMKPGGNDDDEDDRQMRSREQNLSYRPELGSGEEVTKGKWMDPNGKDVEASLEEWYAQRLGAKIGDRLRFDVQGVQIEAVVTSLRKVHWANFQPNFFVLLSPWALKDAPTVWIGSVAGMTATQRESIQTDLVGKFPNVTVFDVSEASKKIMAVMDKISWAVRIVALFSLFTGLVVLAGIALSTAAARRQEAALLKVLGAGKGVILASLGTEFGALGLLSGLLGLGFSTIFGWVLLEKILGISFHLPVSELGILLLAMVVLCAATGMVSSLATIKAKPLAVLREE